MEPTNTSENSELQSWSQVTAAGGVAGASLGAASAFLRGEPIAFMASAYGLNSLFFTGVFIGLRTELLKLSVLQRNPPPERIPLACSSLAAAITGTGFTAAVSGRNKVAQALVMWSCAGFAGQSSVDAVNAWRRRQALAILHERCALAPRASDASAPDIPMRSEVEPPSSSQTNVNTSSRWSWLPFRLGNDHSARVTVLRQRLQEINEDLGEAEPQQKNVPLSDDSRCIGSGGTEQLQ